MLFIIVLLIYFYVINMHRVSLFIVLFQYIFERITQAFTHKLWRVREEVLVCLQDTLNQ